MGKRVLGILAVVLVLGLVGIAGIATASVGVTERVSISSTGEQGDNPSGDRSSISSDGRYVAFESFANNLVPGDTNNTGDVFVYDRVARTTERVSVSSTGEQGNGRSTQPSISSDGRYVAFSSSAYNLVPGDTNNTGDVFVYDRVARTTERVSVSSTGEQVGELFSGSAAPSISADGRYVAFGSAANNLVPGDTNYMNDIFVHDRVARTTERVSVSSTGEQGNFHSSDPSISADGRYVAFYSEASNLVSGDTNGTQDVFIHDRVAGTTERVSVSSTGEQGDNYSYQPSISADGRYVGFDSTASNLVPGDTNGTHDIFVYDRVAHTTERVSVSSTGEQGDNSSGNWPAISSDGRYVAFSSSASNLVPGDTNNTGDIFVRDRVAGTTERVSVSSTGEQGNGVSNCPAINADGRYVGFNSMASNLVPGDTNGMLDIFVRYIENADTVAPVTTIKLEGAKGLNDWYISDVIVTLTATDTGGSGVLKTEHSFDGVIWIEYQGPFTLNTEGVKEVYYRSIDNAGNEEAPKGPEGIKIDKTLPLVNISTPTDGTEYLLNQIVFASWSVDDYISGILSTSATAANGGPIDTASVGAKTFYVTAIDMAGHEKTETATYYVRYDYIGVLQPINNDGSSIFRQGKGRVVPVKFQLKDVSGQYISTAEARLYYAKVTDNVTGTVLAANTTGQANTDNLFRYDDANNQYIYNLDTNALSPGTWELIISLDDGTTKTVRISIK